VVATSRQRVGHDGQVRGRFIVVEGGEGSGKSTQVERLAQRLRDQGVDVLTTFEPGATARGASLRRLLLDDGSPLDARAELLLMAADRAQHVSEVVRPALAAGTTVVCDRYTPSTLAYQGVGRGLGVDAVAAVNAFATGDLVPDIVVVLDVRDDVAAQRRPVAGDRMERAGAEFHERVRAAYRDLASAHGWHLLDANGPIDAVGEAVWQAVESVVAGDR
jgi:dTMP kinase